MRGVRDGGMASLFALALLCLLHASCPVNGLLKCYCDICPETNYTCETDGYCFASTSLKNNVITYARRLNSVFILIVNTCARVMCPSRISGATNPPFVGIIMTVETLVIFNNFAVARFFLS